MIIQSSLFGAMADPNQWRQFSCINENGTLSKQKYSQYMRIFANDGANSTREIPFLVTDKDYTGTAKQRNFLPFKWVNIAYDLNEINPVYFDNLKWMIIIANRHNMSFQFSIFDRCHSLNMKDSPWNLNHNRVTGYYEWRAIAANYVSYVISSAKAAEIELKKEGITMLPMLWELENEPFQDNFMRTGIETIKMLESHGYNRNQIEWGCFYLPGHDGDIISFKGNGELIRSDLFEKFKRELRKNGLFASDGSDNEKYFVTVHNFGNNPKVIDEMKKALGHSHRFSVSSDGEKVKPGPDEWTSRVLPIFITAGKKIRQRKKLESWKFEQLYRGDLFGESMFGDNINGARGISEAYCAAFGEWPVNYGKFPSVATEPEPEPLPVNDKMLEGFAVLKKYLLDATAKVNEMEADYNRVK